MPGYPGGLYWYMHIAAGGRAMHRKPTSPAVIVLTVTVLLLVAVCSIAAGILLR
jgi:hypothetical protein